MAHQNKDLTNYLANKSTSNFEGTDVNITVNVIDSSVITSDVNAQDQKQLGKMISRTVRTVISQEQRQGGLLPKMTAYYF